MAGRPYFYKDSNGTLQRYHYCSHCLTGPFTEDQNEIAYRLFGYQRPTCYCNRCVSDLNLKIDAESKFGKPKSPVGPVPAADPISTPPAVIQVPDKPIEVTALDKPIVATPGNNGGNGNGHKLSKVISQELSGKRPIPLKNNYYAIMAQCSDNSYLTLVTTNPKKDIDAINKGKHPRYKSLPVELVYQRAHNNKPDAGTTRGIISKYKLPQKEKLVEVFERQIFGN